MSFSSDVRDELSRVEVKSQCCAVSEMRGMILACRGLSYRGLNRFGLQIHSENAAVTRRYFTLFKRWLNASCEVYTAKTNQLGERTRYALMPEEKDIPGILTALDLFDEDAPFGLRAAPDAGTLSKPCCAAAFLRGAYLGCGTMNNPEKAYHLEFAAGDEAFADAIDLALSRLEIAGKRSARKGQPIVYLKDAEHISELLGQIGAHSALLTIENIRIMKGMRNDVNRLVNCDSGNMEKTLAAAERQISVIETIFKLLGKDGVEKPLRELAELRLQYPDASLTELGGMLDPPIGKSGVNARMRKLEALAEDLVNE